MAQMLEATHVTTQRHYSDYDIHQVLLRSMIRSISDDWLFFQNFGPETADVYAVYGETGHPLRLPAAFQVDAPFGVNVGPVNPAFFPMMPDSEFDSFLTIGIDGPAARKRTSNPHHKLTLASRDDSETMRHYLCFQSRVH